MLAIAKEDVSGDLQRCFVRASRRYRAFVILQNYFYFLLLYLKHLYMRLRISKSFQSKI